MQDCEVLRDRGVRETHSSHEISDRCLTRGNFIEKRAAVRVRDGVKDVGCRGGASHRRLL